MNKFLIINPFGIGDVLFTTPFLRALKENYPRSIIGYWCNERTKAILKGNFSVDKIYGMSRGDIKRIYKKSPFRRLLALINLIGKIRKEKFDIAFDFSLDTRYGLLSKFAGIKKRIGFDYKNRGRFLTDKIPLNGYSEKHIVEYYSDLLKFARIQPDSASLDLAVTDKTRKRASDIFNGEGIKSTDLLIGMAMGGGESWGKDAVYKQWPAKNFARLAEKLIKDLGARVLLLGSEDEKPLAEIVLGKMAGKIGTVPKGDCPIFPINDGASIVNLTGKIRLEELAAIMKELKLLVCNDGGPLHMAVALGVKTVSIFGPVDEKVYGPYPPSGDHVVIKKDLECSPCYRNFRFSGCSNDRKCLEDITVDEVYEKVRTLL